MILRTPRSPARPRREGTKKPARPRGEMYHPAGRAKNTDGARSSSACLDSRRSWRGGSPTLETPAAGPRPSAPCGRRSGECGRRGCAALPIDLTQASLCAPCHPCRALPRSRTSTPASARCCCNCCRTRHCRRARHPHCQGWCSVPRGWCAKGRGRCLHR